MAKKPDAARGKTTRLGKIKKIARNLKAKRKSNMGMSPGALGGRIKAKFGPRITRPNLSELKPLQKPGIGKKKPLSQIAKKTIKGAGMTGAAMSGQAMKLAKKLKPSGRINADDIKRIKEMMSKKKGK